MSRRSRQRRNGRVKASLVTTQTKQVQGPQLNVRPPQTADVTLTADLLEKYLGRGLVGLGPTLEVLQNRGADELLSQHGYQLYRQMSTDAEVDASLDLLVQASSSQPVQVVSPLPLDDRDHALSQQLADFVNYVFRCFDVDTWRREQTRAMLTFGNACSEVDWDYRSEGEYGDHLVITSIRQQPPEDYGYIVDRWGEVYGVAPLGTAQGVLFPLGNIIPLNESTFSTVLRGAVPRYKLTVWTWEKRGMDPRGTSILRPAYIPWWSKQRAIEEWSCWLGRYSQPSIWGTPGPDAVPICLPDGRVVQPTEKLLEALMQFKSASALALPYGSELNLLQVSGGAGPFLDSIAAFDRQITRAILGQHLATSEGENQSRAAAEVHGLVLRMMINNLRLFIAQMIEKDLVRPLIEANYGDVGHLMPVVDLGDGDGWPPTVTEVAVLMQSGYFTEDQLPKLDRRLGLPVRETDVPTGPAAVKYKLAGLKAAIGRLVRG